MTANPGGAPVGETDMMTTRRPRSDPLARGQGRQHQEGAIHTERTMLTRRLADDMSMLALRKDGLDDGRPLRIGAARGREVRREVRRIDRHSDRPMGR
jgi:hypothetical protein